MGPRTPGPRATSSPSRRSGTWTTHTNRPPFPLGDRLWHRGVDPTVTLVANSIPYSRGRLQCGESGAAGLGHRRPRPPVTEPHHVDRRCRQHMLQLRLGLAEVPALPQPTTADRLLMSPFNPGPGRVLRPELFSRLPAAGRLQCLVMFARLQTDDPRLLLRLRAPRPERTRRAILAGETRLEHH